MILLWGITGDGPFDRVRAALARRGAAVLLVDQRAVLETHIELQFQDRLSARFSAAGQQINLDDVDAAYWRPYDIRRLPAVLAAEQSAPAGPQTPTQIAWSVEESFTVWLEMTSALAINRPSTMASNGSKPFQLAILKAHGFDVPKTLITTDPDLVKQFWTDHAAVIYKSISGARSIVSRLDESHLAHLADVTWCPTQFQQYIPGRDYRVHVIGARTFTTEIVCDADDYRYGSAHGEPANLRPADVPDDVAERCIAVTRSLGLHASGIDLRRAPDGRWFCFEVNPSPGFSYYEANTGQPIAAAIADLLIDGAQGDTVAVHASNRTLAI